MGTGELRKVVNNLESMKIESADLDTVIRVLDPKDDEEVDADGYVQCEGGCDRWFHYLCCGYPALEQLGEDWADEMERLAVEEKFYCPSCRLRDPAGWALSPGYQRLLANEDGAVFTETAVDF